MSRAGGGVASQAGVHGVRNARALRLLQGEQRALSAGRLAARQLHWLHLDIARTLRENIALPYTTYITI